MSFRKMSLESPGASVLLLLFSAALASFPLLGTSASEEPGVITINATNCPCVPRDECPRVYGQSAMDVRELGFLEACMEFGTVRCCGVAVRIEKTHETTRSRYTDPGGVVETLEWTQVNSDEEAEDQEDNTMPDMEGEESSISSNLHKLFPGGGLRGRGGPLSNRLRPSGVSPPAASPENESLPPTAAPPAPAAVSEESEMEESRDKSPDDQVNLRTLGSNENPTDTIIIEATPVNPDHAAVGKSGMDRKKELKGRILNGNLSRPKRPHTSSLTGSHVNRKPPTTTPTPTPAPVQVGQNKNLIAKNNIGNRSKQPTPTAPVSSSSALESNTSSSPAVISHNHKRPTKPAPSSMVPKIRPFAFGKKPLPLPVPAQPLANKASGGAQEEQVASPEPQPESKRASVPGTRMPIVKLNGGSRPRPSGGPFAALQSKRNKESIGSDSSSSNSENGSLMTPVVPQPENKRRRPSPLAPKPISQRPPKLAEAKVETEPSRPPTEETRPVIPEEQTGTGLLHSPRRKLRPRLRPGVAAPGLFTTTTTTTTPSPASPTSTFGLETVESPETQDPETAETFTGEKEHFGNAKTRETTAAAEVTTASTTLTPPPVMPESFHQLGNSALPHSVGNGNVEKAKANIWPHTFQHQNPIETVPQPPPLSISREQLTPATKHAFGHIKTRPSNMASAVSKSNNQTTGPQGAAMTGKRSRPRESVTTLSQYSRIRNTGEEEAEDQDGRDGFMSTTSRFRIPADMFPGRQQQQHQVPGQTEEGNQREKMINPGKTPDYHLFLDKEKRRNNVPGGTTRIVDFGEFSSSDPALQNHRIAATQYFFVEHDQEKGLADTKLMPEELSESRIHLKTVQPYGDKLQPSDKSQGADRPNKKPEYKQEIVKDQHTAIGHNGKKIRYRIRVPVTSTTTTTTTTSTTTTPSPEPETTSKYSTEPPPMPTMTSFTIEDAKLSYATGEPEGATFNPFDSFIKAEEATLAPSPDHHAPKGTSAPVSSTFPPPLIRIQGLPPLRTTTTTTEEPTSSFVFPPFKPSGRNRIPSLNVAGQEAKEPLRSGKPRVSEPEHLNRNPAQDTEQGKKPPGVQETVAASQEGGQYGPKVNDNDNDGKRTMIRFPSSANLSETPSRLYHNMESSLSIKEGVKPDVPTASATYESPAPRPSLLPPSSRVPGVKAEQPYRRPLLFSKVNQTRFPVPQTFHFPQEESPDTDKKHPEAATELVPAPPPPPSRFHVPHQQVNVAKPIETTARPPQHSSYPAHKNKGSQQTAFRPSPSPPLSFRVSTSSSSLPHIAQEPEVESAANVADSQVPVHTLTTPTVNFTQAHYHPDKNAPELKAPELSLPSPSHGLPQRNQLIHGPPNQLQEHQSSFGLREPLPPVRGESLTHPAGGRFQELRKPLPAAHNQRPDSGFRFSFTSMSNPAGGESIIVHNNNQQQPAIVMQQQQQQHPQMLPNRPPFEHHGNIQQLPQFNDGAFHSQVLQAPITVVEGPSSEDVMINRRPVQQVHFTSKPPEMTRIVNFRHPSQAPPQQGIISGPSSNNKLNNNNRNEPVNPWMPPTPLTQDSRILQSSSPPVNPILPAYHPFSSSGVANNYRGHSGLINGHNQQGFSTGEAIMNMNGNQEQQQAGYLHYQTRHRQPGSPPGSLPRAIVTELGTSFVRNSRDTNNSNTKPLLSPVEGWMEDTYVRLAEDDARKQQIYNQGRINLGDVSRFTNWTPSPGDYRKPRKYPKNELGEAGLLSSLVSEDEVEAETELERRLPAYEVDLSQGEDAGKVFYEFHPKFKAPEVLETGFRPMTRYSEKDPMV